MKPARAGIKGLTAVKDVTIDLSESNIGKTVTWLIVWKVAGKDFARIAIGFIIAIISVWLISRSYFTLIPSKRCIKKTGWWIFGTKEYEYVKRDRHENILPGLPDSCVAGLHWLFLCIMFALSAIVAFA